MRIDLLPDAGLPPDLLADLDKWSHEIFASTADLENIRWSGADWRLIVWEGEHWVSSLDLLEREIRVGDTLLKVGGVGGVMTRPEHRRHGYASAAMRRANDWICRERGLPFGFLITGAHLLSFYGALGWTQVFAPLVYRQDGERRYFHDDTVIMVYACSGQSWPSGEIDLCGSPW